MPQGMSRIYQQNNVTLVTGGDIFASEMQTLVNPVNTVGVMGAGLAKKFRTAFPDIMPAYIAAIEDGALTTETPQLIKRDGKWVINFATKKDYRNPSQNLYIKNGLMHIAHHYKEWDVTSIAFPASGCGLGGLYWSDVKRMLTQAAEWMDIPIEIYCP